MNTNAPTNPIDALALAIVDQLRNAIPMPGLTAEEAGHTFPASDLADLPLMRHYLDFFFSPVGFHVYLGREGRLDVTMPHGSFRLYCQEPTSRKRGWAEGFAEVYWQKNARLFATRMMTEEVAASWLEATTRPLGHYKNV